MINFRFHLVSLVAVFLALGLGILVGSTVVDQGIVNRLDTEIKRVGKENSSRQAASKAVAKQNSQLQEYINDTQLFVGDARLEGQSIAVVAERGVDGGVVKKTEASLLAAGADVPGVLWLDDSWELDSPSRVQELQSALGLHGSASATRDAALSLLANRLTKVPVAKSTTPSSTTTSSTTSSTAGGASTASTSSPTSTSTPASLGPVDALTALERAGFLSVTDGKPSAFAAFPARAANVLLITGDNSDFAGTDFTPAVTRALVQVKMPTVVAAVYAPGSDAATAPQRGDALAPILDDNVLSRSVSTVDDLDLVQGRVAAVLSLEVIAIPNNVGHYGYGTNASAPVPPHHS